MKKYLLIIGILFSGYTAEAQVIISLLFDDKLNSGKVEFGLDGGLNLASIDGIDGAENLSWQIRTEAGIIGRFSFLLNANYRFKL
jgi:hypothetical protein